MNIPKLILFDIGGVVIEYSDFFKTASTEQDIPINLINATFDKYATEITIGKISPQELYLKCIDENELTADKSYDFLKSWVNDYVTIKPTYDLILKLSETYDIGLLSNIYKGMSSIMKSAHQIPDIKYVHQFLSCDIGIQKPDLEIFEFVQEKTGLKPNEILFVDDKEENTKVASTLGWQTLTFDRKNPRYSIKVLDSTL